jgi:hypothetical protein
VIVIAGSMRGLGRIVPELSLSGFGEQSHGAAQIGLVDECRSGRNTDRVV